MPRCSLSVCLVILMWTCSMSSGKRYPIGVLDDTCMLTMTRTCLGPKSSSMRFGYSYFTGHEIFNLWFVKHMLRNCTRINLNHSRCLWWFIKLAITASLCEGPFFYFYVESPLSTFMHHLRDHSCHSEFNVHSPKIYYWLIHDYGFACS
jgi:hypothetical protein